MKYLLAGLLLFWIYLPLEAAGSVLDREKTETPTASALLRILDNWGREIENFNISFSLNYRSGEGKIVKVERRRIAYVKKGFMFKRFRYDLSYPEKLSFIVSPEKYIKYNLSTRKTEEEVRFIEELSSSTGQSINGQEKVEGAHSRPHEKAFEIFKNIVMPGATLPHDFRYRSVFNRAKIVKEAIYKNKLCLIISSRSSQDMGHFWVTKDNSNLLKYIIIREDKSQEIVEILKKRKISESLYIPIEVKIILKTPEGETSQFIRVKYYGYAVNRKLPPGTFEARL